MQVLTILFIIAFFVLLFRLLLQKREMKSMTKQLREIRNRNTNILVHSEVGLADELISEINTLLKEIRENRTIYQQKNHALEQMMTNISHDLRTPLTSAMGYIHLIQQSELTEEEKSRELSIIEKRLIRLEELINSFFEFSQIISNERPPEKKEVNLVAILEEAVSHYYDDYCNQSREIIFKCVQHKLIIHSNQNMLMRIFDNLISNALKHGIGNLTITLNKTEDIDISFENELSDSDIDIQHIFDEFYTTDISRTKGNTGLGLAIAKQFTEMLSGNISAEKRDKVFLVKLTFSEKCSVDV